MLKQTVLLIAIVVSGFSVLAQTNLSLVGQLTYGGTELSDIWGHVDATGKEYAIVGKYNGTSIVDVSTPSNPVEVFVSNGANSIWRDLKVWNNHAYIVNETSGGLKIIDMSSLPSAITAADVYQYGGTSYPFNSAHDLYIDENGFAYIMGADNGVGGAIILDLNNNPKVPVEVGRYNDFYLHDGMVRNDTLWGGAVNDGFFTVIDVTNKANPVTMATHNTPSNFTHNCWISDDGHTLYTTDEKPNAYIASYDVSDLNNIQELDRIQSSPGKNVIPHNTFVYGDYLVTSYYRDGVTIHDVSNPSVMVEVGNYDTSPLYVGDGFNGAWGVYPYLPSGVLIVSDIENGLFILNPTYSPATFIKGKVTDLATGLPVDGVDVGFVFAQDSTNTNVLGNYQIGLPNTGNYNLTFTKPGYQNEVVANVFASGGNTVVVDVVMNPYPVAVKEKVVTQNVSIYPLPFKGLLTIEIENTAEKLSVELLDVAGKLIDYKVATSTDKIELSNEYERGIYFVKVYADNELLKTEKVVKL
ncbi:MAG: choice-of-anchor B family protein [Vicingaceae bacterium]